MNIRTIGAGFWNNLYKIMFLVIALLVILYLVPAVYRQLKPKSHSDKVMECLRLGSDAARAGCVQILNG